MDCNSVLNSIRAKGTITLSFVPNVNHLLESEYTCGVKVDVAYQYGIHGYNDSGDVPSMTTSEKVNHGNYTAISAEYTYRVNGAEMYVAELSFGS